MAGHLKRGGRARRRWYSLERISKTMIKFFRRIRQKLLSANRFSKYLIYAIGEIVLVVIGILIALQINNWNERQKLKAYEIKILTEIKMNLSNSREEIFLAIKDDKRWRACLYSILDHLEKQMPYDQNLDSCFGSYYWSSTVQFATSAYIELKNKGVEIVSNHDLRREITTMYDFRLDMIRSEVEVWDSQLLSSTIYPLHTQLFKKYFPESWQVFDDEYARPVDYDSLLKNDHFKNVLSEIISLRNYSIVILELLAKDMEKLIISLDSELIELRK
ncbi:MAG: hypothetical protein KJO77_09830 [Bacteroidia bacterium]|nr:hypothetical protein [Bacteroidia bacterium]